MIIGVDGNEANSEKRVGVGQYSLALLSFWQKWADEENQFRIYLHRLPQKDLPAPTPYFSYLSFGPQRFWTQFALPAKLYLQKEKPAVFFSPAHYSPRFSPLPTVLTIHDLAFFYYPKEFKTRDLWQLKRWTAYSVKKAQKVIAVSQNSKKDLIRFYHLPEEKIKVVYNGYDQQRFSFPQNKREIGRVRRKYQTGADYLLYVGTLQPRKNIISLIKAFPFILNQDQRRRKTLKLVIAGKKGWLYENLFATVRELKLTPKVIFTDFVPDEDLPYLLGGARLFILPSLYEGFGLTALEAMACGAPVLVSKNSSLPEVVGKAGIYLENPEDLTEISQKVGQILDNRDLAETLREKGLKQAQKFSWEKCAHETLTVIQSSM
ncbi:glycosyltransferase family 4 protein [Candidatus Shapirobacteria bacterium]|nr:glycosyltransferase family 4 protein [Candidatus Shapirobacteria bacterium]